MNIYKNYFRNTLSTKITNVMFSSCDNEKKNIIRNTNIVNIDYKSNNNETYILFELFPSNSNNELIIEPKLVKLIKKYFYNYENKEKVYNVIDCLVLHPTNNTYKKIYFDKNETLQIQNYVSANLNNNFYSIITYSMYFLIKTKFFSNNK
jgi:hypothetical protein